MKKVFKLEELDCANCASKIETEISKIEGVAAASVSFMQQKLTIDAPDDIFDDVMAKAKKVVRKIEPDTKIVM